MKEHCFSDVMVFLVGNKADLEHEREVSRDQALRFQRENNIKYWTETSAKSGEHIESMFFDASKFLFRKLESTASPTGSQNCSSDSESRQDDDNQSASVSASENYSSTTPKHPVTRRQE